MSTGCLGQTPSPPPPQRQRGISHSDVFIEPMTMTKFMPVRKAVHMYCNWNEFQIEKTLNGFNDWEGLKFCWNFFN